MAIRERHEVADILSFEVSFTKVVRNYPLVLITKAVMTSSLRPMEGVLRQLQTRNEKDSRFLDR